MSGKLKVLKWKAESLKLKVESFKVESLLNFFEQF